MIDRISKIWALTLTKSVDYGVFAFTYVTNTGAGFSIFQGQNTLLAWIAVIALGFIIYFHNAFPKTAFIMIIAGIIGNLIDRIIYGYVIDFINFKFWPIFNTADALIFIGVAITIIFEFMRGRKEDQDKKKTIARTNNRISKTRNTSNKKKKTSNKNSNKKDHDKKSGIKNSRKIKR
jgi:signal peptidase II